MKTLKFTRSKTFKANSLMGLLMILLFMSNVSFGQTTTNKVVSNERIVKGIISNEYGPLKDVNIKQQGTKYGATTNEKGEFTFPVKLASGDILLISYLGYETQKFTIKDDTTFIKLVLTEDMIEMIGALDSNKPYKSKRKN